MAGRNTLGGGEITGDKDASLSSSAMSSRRGVPSELPSFVRAVTALFFPVVLRVTPKTRRNLSVDRVLAADPCARSHCLFGDLSSRCREKRARTRQDRADLGRVYTSGGSRFFASVLVSRRSREKEDVRVSVRLCCVCVYICIHVLCVCVGCVGVRMRVRVIRRKRWRAVLTYPLYKLGSDLFGT